MLSPNRKRLRTDQRFCPHCSNLLSYKTYRAHKRLYYDDVKDHWYEIFRDKEEPNVEQEAPPSEQCESAASSPPRSPCCGSDDAGWPEESEDDSPPHSEAAFSDLEGKCIS